MAATQDGKANIAVTVGKDAQQKGLNAGKIVREVAKVAGGNGGGKAEFAMAGAKDLTKLDVYKRQGSLCTTVPLEICVGGRETSRSIHANLSGWRGFLYPEFQGHVSVSYTPLDVYKRQPLVRCIFGLEHMARGFASTMD